MSSVRRWTALWNFDYIFEDDKFFQRVPKWFEDKCVNHFYPKTDIARLYLMREWLLDYDRVVWLDADLLIFDPENFNVSEVSDYALSHEVFLHYRKNITLGSSINNSLIVVTKGDPFLDTYISRSEETIRNTNEHMIERCSIGPTLLNQMATERPINRLTCNGLFENRMMLAIVQDDQEVIDVYRNGFKFWMAGANMCHFMYNQARPDRFPIDECVNKLLRTRGSFLNVGMDKTILISDMLPIQSRAKR